MCHIERRELHLLLLLEKVLLVHLLLLLIAAAAEEGADVASALAVAAAEEVAAASAAAEDDMKCLLQAKRWTETSMCSVCHRIAAAEEGDVAATADVGSAAAPLPRSDRTAAERLGWAIG